MVLHSPPHQPMSETEEPEQLEFLYHGPKAVIAMHPSRTLLNIHVTGRTGVFYSSKWINPNGDCQFEAFGKAVGPLAAFEARFYACYWLEVHWESVFNFVAAGDGQVHHTMESYLGAMRKAGEWGDNITLHALSMAFEVQVWVLKKQDGRYTWLKVGNQGARRVYLYLHSNHYENLFHAREVR